MVHEYIPPDLSNPIERHKMGMRAGAMGSISALIVLLGMTMDSNANNKSGPYWASLAVVGAGLFAYDYVMYKRHTNK